MDDAAKEDEVFVSEIMMALDADKVQLLKAEFLARQNLLTVAQFCHVMKSCLLAVLDPQQQQQQQHTSPELLLLGAGSNSNMGDCEKLRGMGDDRLVVNLCELFSQVDVEARGLLEWEVFTSHIVEAVMATHMHQRDTIQNYEAEKVKEVGKRRSSFIKNLYYFEVVDSVVTVDVDSFDFRVFDAAKLELRLTVTREEGQVTCVNYLPALNQYVVSTSDLMLSFVDGDSGELVNSFRTQHSQGCIEWVEATKILYTAESSGTIRAWNVFDMEEKFSMIPPPPPSKQQLFNDDDDDDDDDDSEDPHPRERSTGAVDFAHTRIVLSMLHLQGLEMLATASMDCTILLWDLHTGKHKRSLEGHTKGVCCISYSPEYRFLVSGSFDFDVIVWNPYVEHLILRLPSHTNAVCGVELIANSPQLVTADLDGVFRVWDVRNFSCVQTFTAEDRWNTGISRFVSLGHNKKLLAVGRAMHSFEYQHLDNPELTDDNAVFAAVYSSSTCTFLTASSHDARLWDARTGELLRVHRGISCGSEVTAVCLDRLQRKLLVGDHSGDARAFNYLNGQQMYGYTSNNVKKPKEKRRQQKNNWGLSGNTGSVASSASEQSEPQEPEADSKKAHTAEISKMTYCSEHQLLITASWDGTIAVFDDAEDRGELRRMRSTNSKGEPLEVTSLAYSPELALIASGSSDGAIDVWSFEFAHLEGRCDAAGAAVLDLRFVVGFTALVCADSLGGFSVWSLPPYSRGKPFQCVASWTNFGPEEEDSLGSGRPALLCMKLHTRFNQDGLESLGLFAGDDAGNLAIWDIAPLVNFLATEDDSSDDDDDEKENIVVGRGSIDRLKRPVKVAIARRNIRSGYGGGSSKNIELRSIVSSSTLGDEDANTAIFMLTQAETRRKTDDALVLASLRQTTAFELRSKTKRIHLIEKAHDDSLICIEYVPESEALLSSGMDRLVHLWSRVTGEKLGTLRQGGSTESLKSNWDFVVNDPLDHSRRLAHTQSVLVEMRALEKDAAEAAEAATAAIEQRQMDLFDEDTIEEDDDTTDRRRRRSLQQLKSCAEDGGEKHFVLNRDQYRRAQRLANLAKRQEEASEFPQISSSELFLDEEDDDDDTFASSLNDLLLPSSKSRVGEDALAEFTPVLFDAAQRNGQMAPKRPPIARKRPKPIGPANAGRLIVKPANAVKAKSTSSLSTPSSSRTISRR